jgi:hypothetical protein
MADNGFDDNVQFDPSLWKERVANVSPYVNSFSAEDGRAELMVYVDDAKLYDAMLWILGWSVVGDKGLHRISPLSHPRFPWLQAVAIKSCRGIIFDEKHEAYTPDDVAYATYKNWELVIEFRALTYCTLGDADIDGDESLRWTSVSVEPIIDAISVESGQGMVWAPDPDNPLQGKPLRNNMTILEPKNRVFVDWFQVPLSYLFDTNKSYLPTNLLKPVGCVNDNTFFNFPAGTLLCEPPKLERRLIQLRAKNQADAFTYNVRMSFLHFDPPTGLSPPVRGHNLAPCFINGNYYAVVTKDGLARPYRTADFGDLFKRVGT